MNIFGAVAGGLGDTLKNILRHTDEGKHYARILFAGQFLFNTKVTLVKFSTLVLYKRLFITDRLHQTCNLMFCLVGAWFLACVFGQMFSSKPISASWEHPGHRIGRSVINYPVFLISMAAINSALDLVTVCLPLPVISKLHMNTKRKWAVGGVFMLGGL
ncbi:MAG: hypothetical protein Q9171_006026 [Xanthocarpia ochracea]